MDSFLTNDWSQLFHLGELNWYTFHLCQSHIERNKACNALEGSFILLGVGITISYSWDFEASEIGKIVRETLEKQSS